MNKPLKVVAIVGSLILVMLIGLVIVAKVVITPERVRATVLPLAEEQLNRKVDFSRLGVSIFSGITLEGFTVFEADGKESFVSLDGLVLSPRILPLLTGKVEVDEVRLVRPRIQVVRHADGSFNFSSIGKAAVPKPAAAIAEAEPAGEVDGGIELLVASVTVSGGEVLYRDLALQPGKPFELTLAAIEVNASNLSLEESFPLELTAELAGAPLTVSAQVDPQAAAGEGRVALQGLALKQFSPLAGDGYPQHLEPLTIDLELSGAGSAEKANVEGECTLHLAGQSLVVSLDAPALMEQPLPLTVDVRSKKLQLDKLLPPDSPAAKPSAAKLKSGKASKAEEVGPFDIPLNAKGQVAIDRMTYNELSLDDLTLDWSLAKNLFKLEHLNANLADGNLQGTAQVDLARKGLAYRANFEVDKIQADPLVSAFSPDYRGVLHGGLDLALAVKGRGTETAAIKRNLSGKGDLLIREGRVVGAPLVEGLAAFLGSEELKVLSFKETTGNFTIADGRIKFDSRIDGSQARMQPNGHVTLDGGLDLRLETRLNPKLTRKVAGKGDFAGALKDEQGWGLFPLRVKGSVNKPRFTLDSKAVRKQVKQKAKERAIEELSKEIFKDSESKSAGEQVLKDALKGLFGN